MLTSSNGQALFLGIDGGGSKCKAVLVDQYNKVLGTGISGPANPFHGFEQALASIVDSATLALTDAGLSPSETANIPAGIGLAGVNLPSLFSQVSAWQHPFKAMYLTTDLHIACLGAHQGQDGAVIVTGTGSCGFIYANNRSEMLGGHGFPHGDKGSGAWFGFKVVEQVLLSLDGISEPTLLVASLCSHLQIDTNALNNEAIATTIVERVAGQNAVFYGQMAGLVFAAEQQDDIAKAIIAEGASYINGLANKLLAKQDIDIALMGGLAGTLTHYLAADIQAKLITPAYPSELGAVFFARQYHNG